MDVFHCRTANKFAVLQKDSDINSLNFQGLEAGTRDASFRANEDEGGKQDGRGQDK
jgi:hypothetical protein